MQKFTDIHCPKCGAPADFDIVRQRYLCEYCGAEVGIGEALRLRRGFRNVRGFDARSEAAKFRLTSAACSGCGAKIVFDEREAVSNCAFCGRSLVRKEYLNLETLPEGVIPFALTKEEAAARMTAWCEKNRFRPEARRLRDLLPELKGYYLPYELVRGPVHLTVARMDGSRNYVCEGFLNDAFINCSDQLDNLLLDGMEPFDTEKMTDFDFAYVAGHCVKISDVTEKELVARISDETRAVYTPAVRKTLETRAVSITPDVRGAERCPVLLPVYYISEGGLMAAVNGQTGKVSVRAEKESHYFFLPWWIKALAATLLLGAAAFGAFRFFGTDKPEALFFTAILAFFFLIVFFCLFSDTARNKFAVEAGRKIFTSGEKTFRRERGGLVPNDRVLKRRIRAPVFFDTVKDRLQPVELRFTTPGRVLRMALLSLLVLFLPVVFALPLVAFDLSKIHLGGSAVWFCIFVPVVPVWLLKFGLLELHNNPLVYYRTEKGRRKRYRKGSEKKTL